MTATDPRPELAAKTGREPPEASSPALAGEAGWGPLSRQRKRRAQPGEGLHSPRGPPPTPPAKREGSATERLRTRPDSEHGANGRDAAKSAKRRRPQCASMTSHDIS